MAKSLKTDLKALSDPVQAALLRAAKRKMQQPKYAEDPQGASEDAGGNMVIMGPIW